MAVASIVPPGVGAAGRAPVAAASAPPSATPEGTPRLGAFAFAAVAAPALLVLLSVLAMPFVALALAPFGAAEGAFLLPFVAIGAVVLGLPCYALFGLPLGWLAVRRWHRQGRARLADAVVVGLAANLPSPVVYALGVDTLTFDTANTVLVFTGLGFLFGPVLAVLFGGIYRRAARLPKTSSMKETTP